MSEAKQFDISKKAVIAAFQAVKENAGSYGADEQTIKEFEEHLNNNLYKLWNRMASGSYFPKPVRAVAIPKKNGGIRILGIPTVEDRIAQMVAKMYFEPLVEPMFYNDSYGYRPNKSAIQAVGQARERCFKRDWVLELDIKGLFDNIKHGYLMYMVEKHTQIKWLILYIKRWLTVPFIMSDKSEFYEVLRYINQCLIKWVRRSYKKKNTKSRAEHWLGAVARRDRNLFAHWKFGILPSVGEGAV